MWEKLKREYGWNTCAIPEPTVPELYCKMLERIAYDTNLDMCCFLACCCERFATQKPMQKKMNIQVLLFLVTCGMSDASMPWLDGFVFSCFPQKNLKMFKKKWCTFGALLVHFWCTFKSAPKVHQNPLKVHQKCTKMVHFQKCTKSAPKVHHFFMGVFQDLCLHSSKIWWHSQVVKAFMRTGALM